VAENGRHDRRQDGDRAGDRAPTGRRLTVQDAAAELGITVEAVRSRLKRGTLKREKGEDGTAYVLVEDRPGGDRTQPGGDRASDGADARARQDGDRAPLLYEHMASEIDHLRGQLQQEREASAELRRIVAGLVQRVPELEAAPAPEPPESTRAGSEQEGGTHTPPEQQRPSWWKRVLGVE